MIHNTNLYTCMQLVCKQINMHMITNTHINMLLACMDTNHMLVLKIIKYHLHAKNVLHGWNNNWERNQETQEHTYPCAKYGMTPWHTKVKSVSTFHAYMPQGAWLCVNCCMKNACMLQKQKSDQWSTSQTSRHACNLIANKLTCAW